MTDQFVQVQPNSTGLKVDTSEVVVGANTVERQRMVVADPIYSAGFANIFAGGELNIAMEPSQLFYDAFDGGVNSLTNWKTPVASGTGAIAATNVGGSGSTTLTGGTALNAYSVLESQPTFFSSDPGWIYTVFRLNIENPVLTTGYRFWGLGLHTAPGITVPTIASPIQEGAGWEITTAGKLFAVTYTTGTRNAIQDLSSATGNSKQPTDALAHKYYMWYRGDQIYWAIDTVGNIVATMTTGATGPNINNLPIKLLAVSNSGTAETLVVDGVAVGDTARNNLKISDSSAPWNETSVNQDGSLQISTGQPTIVQGVSAVSSGSVSTLTATFNVQNSNGNTIIVVVGVGNGTAPTISDTTGNTYVRATNVANGTAFNVSIFSAANTLTTSRNTVTVTNGGSAASIAMRCYEVDGLLAVSPAALDTTATATGTSLVAITGPLVPFAANNFVIAGIGVGTATQTITPATGWTNDSGQLTPTTPAGLFSFDSMSQLLPANIAISPSATLAGSEPWAIAAAAFRPCLLGVSGTMHVSDGVNIAGVFPAGELNVALEPTQLFYDSFDGGLNLIERWKAPVASGTGAVAATNVAGSGSTTLSGGTASNAYSLLESIPIFRSCSPGWHYVIMSVTIETPVLATGYRFWGLATTPSPPTITTPLTDGAGWEITTAGKLCAVTYTGGTRNQIADLSAATGNGKQPNDANPHKYYMSFRGDLTYWAIDTVNNIVATMSSTTSGPNNHSLPIKFLAVSNSGTLETLVVAGLVVGDTARNNHMLSDPNMPWLAARIQLDDSVRVGTGQPITDQTISAVSSGSVSTLTATFANPHFIGNTIIVVVAVGNTTAPTITDTLGNTYTRAVNLAATFNASIFYAYRIITGVRNTVTVTNGGTAASIAMTCYEVDGLMTFASVLDTTNSANATNGTPASAALTPYTANEFAVAGIAVGTAAQTITPATAWSNDSGQLNPATPSVLFSMISMSQYVGTAASVTPSATMTSEPWIVVAALFRPALFGVEGIVRLTDGTNVPAVKAASTAAAATDPALVVAVSPNSFIRLTDNTNNTTVKAASTASVVGDTALVVAISPNNTIPHNLTQLLGSAVVASTTGIQKVGIAGGAAGAAIDAAVGTLPTNNLAIIPVPTTGAGAACSVTTTASLTVVNIKSSAGNVYGVSVNNAANAATTFLQFYNTSGSPVLGTSVVWSVACPASGVLNIPPGTMALANFTTGIGIGAATTATGSSAPATAAPSVTIFFK